MKNKQNQGVGAFLLDTDFFDSEAILCISDEFGSEGEVVALRLLCAIHRQGYCLQWTEGQVCRMLRDVRGLQRDMLRQIVERLIKLKVFDAELFERHSILSSVEIQQRYFTPSRRRRMGAQSIPYLLITFPEPSANKDQSPTAQQPLTPPEKKSFDLCQLTEGQFADDVERELNVIKTDRSHYDHVAQLVINDWKDEHKEHSDLQAAFDDLRKAVRKRFYFRPSLRSAPLDIASAQKITAAGC